VLVLLDYQLRLDFLEEIVKLVLHLVLVRRSEVVYDIVGDL